MSENTRAKVVAISGATGGLGPSVVKAFAQSGATLSLIDRDLTKLQTLMDSLGASTLHHYAEVDLLNESEAHDWAAQVVARYGRVDAVLHLVGGWRGGKKIAEFDYADWELLNNLLVKTTWHVIRAFAEPLKASKGRFVLVSSPQAQKPSHTNAAYGACKAASEALTLALADEFKGSGATSNIIQVNAIVTPQMLAEKPDGDYAKSTHAEDIAATMLYVCSDAASSMNGQRLALYGKA
jgi:NAD(P)-dependent dehydrogenase (short-subunit alcohol dehydrogenase family)